MMKATLLSLVSKISGLLPQAVKRRLYQLGPISRLIRRILNRISPGGENVVTVSGGALKGMRLSLDLQSEKDYWLGTYEVDLQETIGGLVKKGWVAYDVGANIGYISFVLAQAVGESGQVIVFEALPANLNRLRENILLNELATRVWVVPGAVTAATGDVQFLVGPSGAMGKVAGSAGREGLHHETITVPGVALDDFVFRDGNPPPQVIKMDIEGGEVLALRGMTQLLLESRPFLFLELHGPGAARIAWEVLTSVGYRICRMMPDLPVVHSLDDLDWKSYLVGLP